MDPFSINDGTLFGFFFKAFAVVLSFIYLVFAIVLLRQTKVMLKTLEVGNNWIIVLISTIQVVIAIILVLLSITIL